MIHVFTWGLLMITVLVGIWVDQRLSAKENQFIRNHIVTVIVIIGWVCFMLGLYFGPLIVSY